MLSFRNGANGGAPLDVAGAALRREVEAPPPHERGRHERPPVEVLEQLAEKITHRSLIVILSDFFDDLESINKGLRHLRYRKHEIMAFQILRAVSRIAFLAVPFLCQMLRVQSTNS